VKQQNISRRHGDNNIATPGPVPSRRQRALCYEGKVPNASEPVPQMCEGRGTEGRFGRHEEGDWCGYAVDGHMG
jgi:hypothetical protein